MAEEIQADLDRKSTDAATFSRFQWEIDSGKALSFVQILLSHCSILFLGINAPFIQPRHPFPMSPLMTFTIWGAMVAVREIQFHIRLLSPADARLNPANTTSRTPAAERVNSPANHFLDVMFDASLIYWYVWDDSDVFTLLATKISSWTDGFGENNWSSFTLDSKNCLSSLTSSHCSMAPKFS